MCYIPFSSAYHGYGATYERYVQYTQIMHDVFDGYSVYHATGNEDLLIAVESATLMGTAQVGKDIDLHTYIVIMPAFFDQSPRKIRRSPKCAAAISDSLRLLVAIL